MPAEILIVDDDRALRIGQRALLKAEGYAVRLAANGETALAAIAEKRPDLVLLDVMMPKRNGFSVCEELRRTDPLLPILFLTAREGVGDELRAFDVGADDYIAKSASPEELLARVRRALARSAVLRTAVQESRRARLGPLEVDFDALTVSGEGVSERLTKTEADFLWLLNSDRGRLFAYGEIIDVLRGGGITSVAVLQTHMSRLRRKLGRAGALLFNERGLGYKWL
jgi:two-component system response regulator MprA